MKQRAAYTLLLAAAAFLSSCLNTPEVVEPMEQTEILSLSEDEVVAAARAHYERYKQSTRVVGGDGEQAQWPWQAKPHAPYDLGEYEIDWSSAYTKYQYNPPRVHTDFDIIKENDFIYFPDTSNHYSGMKLRSRFVSVQTPDTIMQYIATYIPHVSYYDRYYSVRHGGGRIGLMEVNFSGNVLCTTLDGYHYAVYRVRQGEVVSESNLYANFPPREWSYETFFIIMQDFHIGVCKLSVLPEDDFAWTTEIETVIVVLEKDDDEQEESSKPRVVSYGTVYKYTPDLSKMNEYVKFYKHIGGGGSSNDEEEDDDNTSAGANGIDGKTPEEVSEDIFNNYGNLADSVKTKVNTMIAEMAEDCMGKELLLQLMEKNRSIGISYDPNTPIANHQYNPATQTHNITLKKVESEVFLHELFHVYQYITSNYNYSPASANYEIEAQMARYIYMKTSGYQHIRARIDAYKSTSVGKITIGLYEHFTQSGVWNPSNQHQAVYDRAITTLVNKARYNKVTLQKRDGFVGHQFNNINDLREKCK